MGLLESHGRGRRAFRRDALSTASPPVFVVHSLTHAVAALQAAAAARRAVILLSASNGGVYAGAGWWRAMTDAARAAVPAARFSAILDCGDDAGAAQAALRAGVEASVFTGRADVAERLAAIAAARGARLLTTRPQPLLDFGELFFASSDTLRERCADALASV
jgi:DNA-binding NarL/FixJ family response regulator